MFLTLLGVVLVALIFDYINGFHDTANAIATVVSTGVLPMRTAVLLAAIMNLLGAVIGVEVANTIAKMVDAAAVSQVMVVSGLLAAIFWNLFTWYFGIPSSSSHALLGGVLGAAVTKAGFAFSVVNGANFEKTMKGLFLSPIAGFAIGFLVMVALTWLVRRWRPRTVNVTFRWLQMVSAAWMAFAHGKADAQKTMGIIVMALVGFAAVGHAPDWAPQFLVDMMRPGPTQPTMQFAEWVPEWMRHLIDPHDGIPRWVKIGCALAMAGGTAAGGTRIIKTMGSKIIELRPIQGFAAETSAAITILTAASLGAPISTTHVISSSIMGVGASQRVSAVRWGVTAKILWAWVLTIPISFVVGSLIYLLARAVIGDA